MMLKWWGAGVVICLERGADLHMDQLMPLPLTVSCFSKIQIGFTFLVLDHPRVVPEKWPLNGCKCVAEVEIITFNHCDFQQTVPLTTTSNFQMVKWHFYIYIMHKI